MVDGRDAEMSAKIDQLQDLRFVHLLFDGESVPDFGSRRHKVLLLDVAYLSVRRALQVDFEGWTDRSKRRRRQLVYSEGAGARHPEEAGRQGKSATDRSAAPGASPAPPGTLQLFDEARPPLDTQGD